MDTTYTFVCNAYRDFAQLSLNLPALRRCYPDERVVIISDGDPDPRLATLTKRLSCELISGDRLYRLDCGGKVVSRLLNVFLAAPGGFLVKFDTDTRFFHRFMHTPPDGASGSIWGAYGLRYLQGGCRLLSRSCAQKIADSGLLDGSRYNDYESWCPPAARDYYRRLGMVSEDFIVRDILLELEFDIYDHPEIFSAGHVKQWRWMDAHTLRRVINADGRYAVTHPWKLADVIPAAQSTPSIANLIRDFQVETPIPIEGDYLNDDYESAARGS